MAALDHIHVRLSVNAAEASDFVASLTTENERYARLLAEAREELAAFKASAISSYREAGEQASRSWMTYEFMEGAFEEAKAEVATLKAEVADLRKINAELGDVLYDLRREKAAPHDVVMPDGSVACATHSVILADVVGGDGRV